MNVWRMIFQQSTMVSMTEIGSPCKIGSGPGGLGFQERVRYLRRRNSQ